MAKKYHRKKLNQAIAAACLAVTVVPVLATTPAIAGITVTNSTYTVNTGSGNPGQVILGNSGVLIVDTTVNGGTVSGSSVGVKVTGGATAGSISNSGTISGSSAGIRITDGGDIIGGITNVLGATIQGTNSSSGVGIYISNSTMTGAIVNNGTISGGTGSSSAAGIKVGNSSDISGGITNTGTISGYAGILVKSSSDISGGIYNNGGTISGQSTGIHVEGSNISGGIKNTGTIEGQGNYGIYVKNGDISGDSINSIAIGVDNLDAGTIRGSSAGIYIEESNFSGRIFNDTNATIQGTNSSGVGIYVNNATMTGAIVNHGTIFGGTGSSAVGIRVSNSADIGGGITNTGTIQGASTGIRIESNSTVSGGITNSGTIQGGNYAIYINSPSAPITITNTGILDGAVELADGILNLNGTAGRVTGAVNGGGGSTVNVNGTFTSESTFSVDAFNIAPGGIFNMAYGVIATSAIGVSNAGTLSVAAGDTVTITGNYTQIGDGVFQTGASSGLVNGYGKLVVTGTADLTANNKIDVKVSPGDTLANGNVLASVLSAGTLTAGTLIVTDNSAVWDFTGVANGNAIDLTTQQSLTFVDAVSGGGISPAAGGVAGALDVIQAGGATGDMQTVLNTLGALGSVGEVGAAVSQLMPGFTGGSAHIAQGLASSGGSRVVHEHMAGGAQGLSSGEPMFKDRMLWAQPFYSWTDQNERKGVAGYNANSYGIALGADGKVDEQWRVGAALSFAKGDVDGDSPVTRESLDINTYQLTLYASDRLSEATSLNLQAGFGINDNDSSRHIVFGGLDRIASGDFSSWHTLLDAELEHRYKVSEKTTLAAYLRGQYSYVKVEDYTETGAGAINLHMDSNSEDSLVLSVGGKAAYALADGMKLTGHLGVGYDFMASQSSVTATFSGGGPTFITDGLDPSAVVMQGGIGFEMLNANGMTVTVRYDVDGRTDYANQTATLNFKLPF